MAWWAIDLSEFDIQYKPCLALNGQILADFFSRTTPTRCGLGNVGWWILNVVDASQQTGAGVGLKFKAPTGERIEQAIQLDFPASNNETEYEAILDGVDLAKSVSPKKKLIIHSDSQCKTLNLLFS